MNDSKDRATSVLSYLGIAVTLILVGLSFVDSSDSKKSTFRSAPAATDQHALEALSPAELKKVHANQRQVRIDYGATLEHNFLMKGMDVYVTIAGKDKTTLDLKYVLFNRAAAYQLMNNPGLHATLISLGFKKVFCRTGFGDAWSFTVG